jgi:formylglycine-generating enzyme required for sulfatase activity
MGKLLRLLTLACAVQAAGAQGLFKGFIPDENGTNLDASQGQRLSPNVASGTVIKDCAECPEMVVIPAGSFVMGSNKNPEEQPRHTVFIRSFLMGATEVTQMQWSTVMGGNPSHFASCGDSCPVENVSWRNVQRFITKLNQKTGQKYRLPSEAEWEYAARAGTTTRWSFGDDQSKLRNYARYAANSVNKTQEVALNLPNPFGLYDMYGNVWEWTQDCWHENYAGAPGDGSAWTVGSCVFRVIRGGGWINPPSEVRSSTRNGFDSSSNGDFLTGFRLTRDL